MEFLKKLDIKTWFIIILGVALIISFFFGQRNKIGYHKDEIKALHNNNALLIKSNDSLKNVNAALDSKIADINKILVTNETALNATQSELDKLKKRQHETFTNVNHLSANGVSNAFSDYLSTKGANPR